MEPTIEQLQARVDALETALSDLLEPGDDEHLGYAWQPETRWHKCLYCDEAWKTGEPETHGDGCPITAAWAVLDGEDEE